jgi:hypothetical protein
MSALTPKADIRDYGWDVRFVPIADIKTEVRWWWCPRAEPQLTPRLFADTNNATNTKPGCLNAICERWQSLADGLA